MRASFDFQVLSISGGVSRVRALDVELTIRVRLSQPADLRARHWGRLKLSLRTFGRDLSRLATKTRFSPAEPQQKLA